MVAEAVKKQNKEQAVAQEGKYLTFALSKEEYGLEILQVREIIGMMHITVLPQVPVYVKGVINLRGKIIPVIELRAKFGMESIPYTSETCIIVLNLKDLMMGIIVDRVSEVVDIVQDRIEQAPYMGASVSTDFITGMGKVGEKVVILLNIEKVLTADQIIMQKAGITQTTEGPLAQKP